MKDSTITPRKLHEAALMVLATFIIVMIFSFSSQNGEESSGISYKVTLFLLHTFADGFDKLPDGARTELINVLHPIVRKAAHFSVYFALGAVLYGYFHITPKPSDTSKRIAKSVFFCALLASSDEIHQLFTPGRCGSFADVILDTAGAFTGIIFLWAVIAVIVRIKSRVGRKKTQSIA